MATGALVPASTRTVVRADGHRPAARNKLCVNASATGADPLHRGLTEHAINVQRIGQRAGLQYRRLRLLRRLAVFSKRESTQSCRKKKPERPRNMTAPSNPNPDPGRYTLLKHLVLDRRVVAEFVGDVVVARALERDGHSLSLGFSQYQPWMPGKGAVRCPSLLRRSSRSSARSPQGRRPVPHGTRS